ncbi:uncharacterized protein RAG0_16807 [Rhynchosporium agropyri]|uniref:Uncharacterized protein n=1 Tax=Rhynchosporium agropyri TaxID=914238 RepID=A0A1E1LS41_9HELO|nr:uncharacterized protein RAG0_16807 [Rhynchosporium agropyri]
MFDNFWTPETIGTIVYRAILIFIGAALLWKQYHQTELQLDEERLDYHNGRRQQLLPVRGATTTRRERGQIYNVPTGRLRDHFRETSNDILASAFGIDVGSLAVGLQPLRRLPAASLQATPSLALEVNESNIAPTLPVTSFQWGFSPAHLNQASNDTSTPASLSLPMATTSIGTTPNISTGAHLGDIAVSAAGL